MDEVPDGIVVLYYRLVAVTEGEFEDTQAVSYCQMESPEGFIVDRIQEQ